MNLSILEKIGLTEDQATTYRLLLQAGSLTPPQLATQSGESRTNAYMALAKLEELGLATRLDNAKKLTYQTVSPAQLEELIARQEQALKATRSELQAALPDLLTEFYTNTHQPGVRFYSGPTSLHKVYQDHLDTGQPVYFVRTPADEQFFGKRLYDYMEQRAERGITAEGIAPFTPDRQAYSNKNDKHLKRKMTWCAPQQYQAPVEISIYGNKTAFISFGKEVVASIIDSPQIAEAMKELFKMAQRGAHTS